MILLGKKRKGNWVSGESNCTEYSGSYSKKLSHSTPIPLSTLFHNSTTIVSSLSHINQELSTNQKTTNKTGDNKSSKVAIT